MLSTSGRLLITFSVTAKGATPSCRHARDLSEFARLPKLVQIDPPLVLSQNGPESVLEVKVPATMRFGLSGSTARLGSEFWPVSALAALGMTSMTGIACAAGAADSSATADTAQTVGIRLLAALDDLLGTQRSCISRLLPVVRLSTPRSKNTHF